MRKGYDCFPVCVECLDVEKKEVVIKGRQDVIQIRKEKGFRGE